MYLCYWNDRMWHVQPCLNMTQCLFIEILFAYSYGRNVEDCENIFKNTFKNVHFWLLPTPWPTVEWWQLYKKELKSYQLGCYVNSFAWLLWQQLCLVAMAIALLLYNRNNSFAWLLWQQLFLVAMATALLGWYGKSFTWLLWEQFCLVTMAIAL